ncbi:MAG: cytochrome c-type biogenesis protein CcmH [Bryobacterales bacterium]|nr:cytochrome c-type biogenesis protein CcmH [Bryobacterales bacterium]
MRQWRSSLVLFALVAAGLAQTGSTPLTNADVRRVGETLRCMCGCSYTVTSCNMLNCSGAEQARAMLLDLVQKDLSDDQIRAEFVKIHGRVVLTKPPSDGFNLVGWVMPFAAAAAGLAFVFWLIAHLYRRAPATPIGVAVDSDELKRYREQMEKDFSKLD